MIIFRTTDYGMFFIARSPNTRMLLLPELKILLKQQIIDLSLLTKPLSKLIVEKYRHTMLNLLILLFILNKSYLMV